MRAEASLNMRFTCNLHFSFNRLPQSSILSALAAQGYIRIWLTPLNSYENRVYLFQAEDR